MGIAIGIGIGVTFGVAAGEPLPIILLSNASVPEDAEIGDLIGTLSVVNGSGSYTFSITADPDSKFAIDGSGLEVGAALNYDEATSHSVTIEADNGVDDPISRAFTISVTNVLEVTLSALTLDEETAEPGSPWSAAITGKSSGSTIVATSSDGTLLSVADTTVSGTFAIAGTPDVTLTETHPDATNSPRDSVIGITVTDELPVPVATWVSGPEDNTPELSVEVPEGVLVEDDDYVWQFDTVDTFDGADFFEVPGTVNATDALDGDIDETITELVNDTWYARFKVTGKTEWSNTISETIASASYEAETVALVARMTTPPTTEREVVINDLIKGLKDADFWDRIDVLKLYAAADSQAACLNWKSTSFNSVVNGANTFTADEGFTGAGGTGISEYNMGTAGGNYTQNDNFIGVYSRVTSAGYPAGVLLGYDSGAQPVLIYQQTLGDTDRARVQSNDEISAVDSNVGPSFFSLARNGASTGYFVGSGFTQTSISTSVAVLNETLKVLSVNSVSGTSQVMAFVAGGYFSLVERDALKVLLDDYLTAVGAL